MISPRRRHWGKLALVGFVAASTLMPGCAPSADHKDSTEEIVAPYAFSIVGWEIKALWHEAGEVFSGQPAVTAGDTQTVKTYFAAVDRIGALEQGMAAVRAGDREGDEAALGAELAGLRQKRAELGPAVEAIVARQIRETLSRLGIYNPATGLRVSFPPVNFRLGEPPKLLVVSPRDRIESTNQIELKQETTIESMEAIEGRVDDLGVSSLVVELGGFGGTFPAFVADGYGVSFAIDTAIEEWLHQYLVFSPLGFLYLMDLLGVSPNYEVATIDETVASMVSKEIGALVYADYYEERVVPGAGGQGEASGFDFNREMREIRLAVDGYLARGEVDEAEEFMEERRHYLAANGYYIRKLNQAYFAFHGTYADGPTSVDPIGEELRTLRARSASIKDFLDKASQITSRADLQSLLAS